MDLLDTFAAQCAHVLWAVGWQVSVLVALIWIVSLLSRRASPAFRYYLWCVVLLRLCLPVSLEFPLGIGSYCRQAAEVCVSPVIAVPDALPAAPVLAVGGGSVEAVQTAPGAASSIQPQVARSVSLARKIAVAWMLSVAALGALICLGVLRIRKLVRTCPQVTRPDLLALLGRLCAILGIRRPVELRAMASPGGVGGPVVVGALRPRIILPARMVREWSVEELEPVLLHELAHVRRSDLLVNWIQMVLQALYWFHPLVWYANRKIRQERELICDDLAVLHVGTGRKRFGRSILRVMEESKGGLPFPSAALALTERRSSLGRRIRRIMARNYRLHKRMGKVSVVILLALCGACMAVAGERRARGEKGESPAAPVAEGKEEQLQKDFKEIAGLVLSYRKRLGLFPETLEQLGKPLPKDVYSPSGEDYYYEADFRRFIISSCGEDGIYGNDDDEVYVGFRKGSRTGKRPDLDRSDNEQYEYVFRGLKRPEGNSSIGGRALSAETGEPVNHATVYLFYTATSDALFIMVASDGSYEFKDIPAGRYCLQVVHTIGYQGAVYNPENEPAAGLVRFTLRENENRRGVDFRLERAFRISGRVLDERGGPLLADVKGLHVLAWAERPEPAPPRARYYIAGRSLVSRVYGSYLIDGLDGRPVYVMAIDWHACDKDDPYPPRYYPGTFSRPEARQITFGKEASAENVDIRLEKKGGQVLEGIVTDESSKPVPNAFLAVHHQDMLFDFVAAYTDDQGRYRIESLGPGEFLVHVDARPNGFVRTRKALTIDASKPTTRMDLALKLGATISGRIMDEKGDEIDLEKVFGHARTEGPKGEASSFSLTGIWNRHMPKDVRENAGGSFLPGQGDYPGAAMFFPSKDAFLIPGVMPGRTRLEVHVRAKGKKVRKILYQGKDILETGLETQPGQVIEDVTIVIGSAETAEQ